MMIPNCDNMQMSMHTLYGECADVLNVLIKSATATHVSAHPAHMRWSSNSICSLSG